MLSVWCNPEAMAANLQELTKTHAVKKLAMIDQFPFTDFLETARCCSRGRRRSRAARSADVAWRAEVAAELCVRGSGGHAIHAHVKARIADAAAACSRALRRRVVWRAASGGHVSVGGVECAVERPIHDEPQRWARGRRRIGADECAAVQRGARSVRVPEDLGAAAVGDAVCA